MENQIELLTDYELLKSRKICECKGGGKSHFLAKDNRNGKFTLKLKNKKDYWEILEWKSNGVTRSNIILTAEKDILYYQKLFRA